MTRYPFAPLAEAMAIPLVSIHGPARTAEASAARELGISGRTAQQYRREGMSAVVAERMALKAGWHPANIWPDWYDSELVECADRSCSVQFVPARANHRFCSPLCCQRTLKRTAYKARYASDPAFRESERQKSQEYRQAHRRAVSVKAAAYYRANAEELKAKKRARLASRG